MRNKKVLDRIEKERQARNAKRNAEKIAARSAKTKAKKPKAVTAAASEK